MYNYTQKTTNVMKELNILLSKTLSMFRYEGLPDSIPQRELERQLQTKGYAFITEFKGKLYSFTDGLGGEPDPYGNPTKITIANPALKYNATLDLEKDGVLIRGDSMMNGLRYLLEKYVTMMNENEVTMMVNSFNARMPALISAGDDKTRESAEQFLQRIVSGEMGVIAENRLFDGIKVHSNSNSGVGSFTQLIEYQQYLKATLYNELGLEMNNNMKRERLTQDEVNMTDIIYPFIDNMLTNREMGIEQVNKMYGKEITIGLDSIWAKHTPNDAWDDEEFYAELDEYLQLLLSQEGAPQPMGEPVEEPVEEDVLPGVSEEELMDMLEQLKAISEDDEDVDRESGHPDGDSAGSVTDDGEGFGVAPESGGDSGTVSGDYGDDSEPDGDNTGEDKGTSGGDTELDAPEPTEGGDNSGDGTTTDEPVGDDDSSNTSGDGDTNESGSDDGRRIVGDIQTNETRIELVVSRELTGDADSGTHSEADLSDAAEQSEDETTGTSDWAGSSLSDETETTTGDAGNYIEIHVEAEDVIVEAVVEEAEEKEEGDEDDES